MDVTFYNNADDSVIGVASGVASGARAEILWQGLTPSTSYTWYAIADNGSGTATSADWTFTSGTQNWFWRLSTDSTWRFYLAGIKILSWTSALLTFKKKVQLDGGADLNGEINIVCDDDDVITYDGNIIYYL
jgi:ABC-type Fe3+-siderophore transport system permease subunit